MYFTTQGTVAKYAEFCCSLEYFPAKHILLWASERPAVLLQTVTNTEDHAMLSDKAQDHSLLLYHSLLHETQI